VKNFIGKLYTEGIFQGKGFASVELTRFSGCCFHDDNEVIKVATWKVFIARAAETQRRSCKA
jgi:hypothetical protein